MNKYVLFVGIGFELVGLIVGAVFLGQLLEEKYNSKGLLTAGCILLALVGWFIHIIFLLKKVNQNEN